MAHPNEELVRRAFDAFAKGDVDTLRELTDPDAVWHNPGRNQLSGDHRGVDAILRFFAKTAELTGGTFRADLHDVVVNDDHAVAIYVARAEREGRTFETRSVLVQHIRNGKLVETWLLEDRGATRCGAWRVSGSCSRYAPEPAAGQLRLGPRRGRWLSSGRFDRMVDRERLDGMREDRPSAAPARPR
jgi:ketosteroid isomerase-like protein